jgi:hypothetical protein
MDAAHKTTPGVISFLSVKYVRYMHMFHDIV